MTIEEEFSRIASTNMWGSPETPCGPGSTLEACRPILATLPAWLSEFKVKSIVDLGCGDWHWMKCMGLVGIRYDGFDIIKAFILANKQRYETDFVRFYHADILEAELPTADLVICKDVLGHLPNDLVIKVLEKVKASGAKLLAASTSIVWPASNREGMKVGMFSPIDLEGEPFSLGIPLAQVHVPSTVGNPPKVFALWELP